MQPDVDLRVDAHAHAELAREVLVLSQAFRGVDKPLQLSCRIERRGSEFRVEAACCPHGHGFADEDVGIRELAGGDVQERLVEHHQRARPCSSHHFAQQRDRRQRLHDDAIGLVGADGARQHVHVGKHACPIHEQDRMAGALTLQHFVQGGKVGVVRAGHVGGTPEQACADADCSDARCAAGEQRAPFQASKTARRWSLSMRPSGSNSARTRLKSSKRG